MGLTRYMILTTTVSEPRVTLPDNAIVVCIKHEHPDWVKRKAPDGTYIVENIPERWIITYLVPEE